MSNPCVHRLLTAAPVYMAKFQAMLFAAAMPLSCPAPSSTTGRQHADSASHRALPPQSIDDQRRAAAEIRATAPAALQESVNAFYYEKLVYLASMILRRANADAYRVQLYELQVAIRAGAHDPQLGRNPQLPRSIRLSAFLTLHMPRLWRWACRTFLKDRQ